MYARHVVAACAATITLALVSTRLAAQNASAAPSIGFAAGGALMYGNLTGGDFSGTKAAAGFDVHAGVTRGPWSLLVAYDRSNHGHDDSSGDFVVSNIALEPRYAFVRSGARITPYLAARVGRSTASFEEPGGFTSDASGYLFGVGAGILWPLGGPVQVDAGVNAARVSHDYGEGDYSAAEKGNQLSVRVGLRWASHRE